MGNSINLLIKDWLSDGERGRGGKGERRGGAKGWLVTTCLVWRKSRQWSRVIICSRLPASNYATKTRQSSDTSATSRYQPLVCRYCGNMATVSLQAHSKVGSYLISFIQIHIRQHMHAKQRPARIKAAFDMKRRALHLFRLLFTVYAGNGRWWWWQCLWRFLWQPFSSPHAPQIYGKRLNFGLSTSKFGSTWLLFVGWPHFYADFCQQVQARFVILPITTFKNRIKTHKTSQLVLIYNYLSRSCKFFI